MWISVWPTYMYVYHVCIWCPWRSDVCVRSLGIRVMDGCKSPCGSGNWTQVIERPISHLNHWAIFCDRISLYSPGWPRTHDPLASVSPVGITYVCHTTPLQLFFSRCPYLFGTLCDSIQTLGLLFSIPEKNVLGVLAKVAWELQTPSGRKKPPCFLLSTLTFRGSDTCVCCGTQQLSVLAMPGSNGSCL